MNEMQNNNSTKNYGNQVNISTAMITIWDSVTGAQLKLSALNNGFGVAIWLPFISPDGYRKYPTENRFSTVLNQKNALAFERAIVDIIIPAYDKGENRHAGLFTNNNNSTMLEVEVKDGDFYLLMHRNCDPTTKLPRDTIRFKFDSTNIVDNYNSASGEMEIIPIQADFFVFAKALFAYNSLIGGYLAAHGSSMANAAFNQKFMEYMRAIADSVHAQLPAPNSYQYNGPSYTSQSNNAMIQQNYNANNNITAGNVPSVNPTEVSSLSDLVG